MIGKKQKVIIFYMYHPKLPLFLPHPFARDYLVLAIKVDDREERGPGVIDVVKVSPEVAMFLQLEGTKVNISFCRVQLYMAFFSLRFGPPRRRGGPW